MTSPWESALDGTEIIAFEELKEGGVVLDADVWPEAIALSEEGLQVLESDFWAEVLDDGETVNFAVDNGFATYRRDEVGDIYSRYRLIIGRCT